MEPYGKKNDQFTHSIISPSTQNIAVFFLLFVEIFSTMAVSLLCLLTFRRGVRHVILSFSWHLLFLSSLVGLQNRVPTVNGNIRIGTFSNWDFQDFFPSNALLWDCTCGTAGKVVEEFELVIRCWGNLLDELYSSFNFIADEIAVHFLWVHC